MLQKKYIDILNLHIKHILLNIVDKNKIKYMYSYIKYIHICFLSLVKFLFKYM